MKDQRRLSVTALVCTRDRGERILPAVESLLQNDYSDFELLIIDQSGDDRTALALVPFLRDTRVRYLHTATRGLGAAHNVGLKYAWGEALAITDDDCTVPRDWLTKIVTPFTVHPKVGLVFCNVRPMSGTEERGFVPHYERRGETLLRGLRDKAGNYGIGAGMAVRRSAALSIGGFDDMLGPGAFFPSFDDVDMALRLLLRGHSVYETDATHVDHYGFRNSEQTRHLVQRDGLAIGAGYAKLLRCGHYSVLKPFWDDLQRIVLHPGLRYFARREKHLGARRAKAIAQGFKQGWGMSIDRATMRFTASPAFEKRFAASAPVPSMVPGASVGAR